MKSFYRQNKAVNIITKLSFPPRQYFSFYRQKLSDCVSFHTIKTSKYGRETLQANFIYEQKSNKERYIYIYVCIYLDILKVTSFSSSSTYQHLSTRCRTSRFVTLCCNSFIDNFRKKNGKSGSFTSLPFLSIPHLFMYVWRVVLERTMCTSK